MRFCWRLRNAHIPTISTVKKSWNKTEVMNGSTANSSGSDLTSLDTDGIELEDLEASHLGDLRTAQYDLHDDIGHDDEQLLGSNARLDRIRLAKPSRWRQVSGIVVEVGACLPLGAKTSYK